MTISNQSAGLRAGVCTSSTRPATPYEGQVIYETDTDKTLVYSGSAWLFLSTPQTTEIGTFSAYTPTWTTTGTQPAIGNGTLVGRFARINKLVYGEVSMIAGGTTTFGTNQWKFSLPVTAATPLWAYSTIGYGRLFDSGTTYMVSVIHEGNTTNGFWVQAGPSAVMSNQPFTWGAGDELSVCFTYQAA